MTFVTSFTLVWIKIQMQCYMHGSKIVTSFTLVWIKIDRLTGRDRDTASHELHARVD